MHLVGWFILMSDKQWLWSISRYPSHEGTSKNHGNSRCQKFGTLLSVPCFNRPEREADCLYLLVLESTKPSAFRFRHRCFVTKNGTILLGYSRNCENFVTPKCSLPPSKKLTTGPYPESQHPFYILLPSSSSSRRWTSFSRKFWPSQRPLSISLDPGRKLSSFWSSFGRCPVWCYPPICTWVFLVIFWLEVSN